MRRSSLQVRPATPADLPALLNLFDEMRDILRSRAGRTPEQMKALAEERYLAAMTDPDARLLVAAEGTSAEVVGMMHLVIGVANSLTEAATVNVSQMHVTGSSRQRGAGKALLAAAAAWAEERGIDAVSVSVPPQSRESARFYARLGFTPVVVRRVAPVAVLRRRLGPDAALTVVSHPDARTEMDRRGMRARLVSARTVRTSRPVPAGRKKAG